MSSTIAICIGVLACLIVCCVGPCCAQPPPVIEEQPIVANLHEEAEDLSELVCINCTSDLKTEVSRISITPPARFFDIYKLAGSEKFCIYYLASLGPPSYTKARLHNIEIECTDAIGQNIRANVEIRIRTNEPPNILSDMSNTCDIDASAHPAGNEVIIKPAGFILFNDSDPNDIFDVTFTTVPPQSAANYEIYQPDPLLDQYKIRAKNDLAAECSPAVTFMVSVSDGKNNPVGPVVIDCTIANAHTPPKLTNVDRDIFVSEDNPIGTSIFNFNAVTTVKNNDASLLTYTIETVPAAAIGLFDTTSNPGELTVNGVLNYEDPTIRNVNLTIWTNDGTCPPQKNYLFIRTTDANDLPTLGPKNTSNTVYEGKITFNPELRITDEDKDDSWTYSIVGGNDNDFFTIDPRTGVISSVGEYDIDGSNSRMKDTAKLIVQVQDEKGKAVDTATVNLFILDANDNPPVFDFVGRTSYQRMDCANAGDKLTTLSARDQIDSDFEDNNYVLIVPTANAFMSVNSRGDVIQTRQIPAGTVSQLTIYAEDRGRYPDKLLSRNPVTITLVGTDCTTTRQPVTVIVVSNNGNGGGQTTTTVTTVITLAPVTTTVTPVVLDTCTGFFCDAGNIALLALASLLGLALLGLLSALLYRYCCNKPAVEVKRVWTPPKKIRPITPPTPPRRPRTPPTPPPRIEYVPTPIPVPVVPPPPPMMRVRKLVPIPQQQQMVKIKSRVPVQQNVRIKQLVPVPGNATAPAPT